MNTVCKTKRILAISALAAGFFVAAGAIPAHADPRVMIGTKGSDGALSVAITWAAQDGGTIVTPWSSGSNECVYVIQGAGKLGTSVFPDVPAVLDNTSGDIRANTATLTFPQMTINAGARGFTVNGDGNVPLTMKGSYTIPSGVAFPLSAMGVGNHATKKRNVKLDATLTGQSDSSIPYSFTIATTPLVNPVTSTLTVSGDLSAFKGTYVMADAPTKNVAGTNYTGRAYLVFASATAFGDPTSAKADAVTLGEEAYFSLGAGVEQYATRGVTVAAGKKGGVEAGSGDSWTLTAPVICESGATFAKVGEGAVTLDGDCTDVSAIEVTEGTLVLGALGSFANGLAVAVKPGATLVQNKYVGNIAVTCEEGGTYEQDIQYVVPYSNATSASTPLDFTAAMPELPLSIRLTESVEIASFADNGYAAKRIDVARLPSDTTATAADFTDATEKFCGLPKTSFEIESRDGFKALVLVAKPVVWSIGTVGDTDSNGPGINGNNRDGIPWSNGANAQPGYDYLVTNYVRGTGYYGPDAPAFNGDSLTFYGDANTLAIAMTSGNVDFSDATYCGNVEIYYNQSYLGSSNNRKPWTGITRGTATIAEGATLTIQTRQPKDDSTDIRTNHLDVAVFGEGNLKLTSGKLKNNDPYYFIPGGAPVYLGGDNSGFSGKMIVTCYGSPTESDGTTLHIEQAASFGGAMDAATADGVLLEKYGFLYPETSMTLSAANRGITVTAGGFDVPEGVTLTVAVPLTVDGAAIKRGAGELAFSGAATFASGGFAVKEGTVRALSDAAVAGDFSFADGTTIVLDPGAGLVNGFTGNFAVTGEGTPKVTVVVDTASEAFNADGAATLPICTVPATAADLTGSFTLAKVRGCSAELVKENVTVNGAQCVRYSEHFSKSGTVIYMR
jgi:hypothetical protein